MSGFNDAFAFVVGAEGGFTADPADPGNWTGGAVGAGACRGTKYGISAASFPTLDIAALGIDAARALYRANYWRPVGGDGLPAAVALVCFDAAVNQGVGTAARLLQQAAGVAADGVVGPLTLAAANAAAPRALLAEIGAQRALRYAGDAAFARFGLGWCRRLMRVELAAAALAS